MRAVLMMTAALTLVACGQPEEAVEPADAPAAEAPAAQPAPEPAPPVQPMPADYVGRWAANPGLCADGAWVFEPRRLATAGEVSCEFTEVDQEGMISTVQAMCTAQAPAEPATLTLEVLPDGRLAVGGGPFAPISLVRCPA